MPNEDSWRRKVRLARQTIDQMQSDLSIVAAQLAAAQAALDATDYTACGTALGVATTSTSDAMSRAKRQVTP